MDIAVGGFSHADKDIEASLDLLRSLGVTSIQTYICWNKVEKTPGVYDWSEYDADALMFKKHGLKWVPFVIVGPWYATPEFVRRDPKMVMLRCLEHGRDSAIPSIWCPRLRDYVRDYLRRFSDHYMPMGVIESFNIGISGDYGEAIYSVWGNWPGEYHSHPGYWCGDALAVADFQRSVIERYPGGVGSLNRAWKTNFASFDEVRPFLPAKAPSERAWQELLQWYRGSMASYAGFFMKTARATFPGIDLYLCTGGDMAPEHGSDFSADAKLAAEFGCGMRITNEASSYPMNVRLTRLVGSSCRFYGAYFGHEPASVVTPEGMLGRIFNAVSSGARQLFLYNSPDLFAESDGQQIAGPAGRFVQANAGLLKVTSPIIDTALYYPNPSVDQARVHLEPGQLASSYFGDLASQMRRFVDFDFVDDRLIRDGALKGKSVLIIAAAEVMDGATTARVEQWVREGGALFILGSRPTDWDGSTAAFDALAGLAPQSDEVQGISELLVKEPKTLPLIAGLPDVFITRGFTDLGAGCEPLLSMRYAPKVAAAWRRRIGAGEVFAYYGPMDLKPAEQNWMVVQKLPLRFVKDGIRACVSDGVLNGEPATLNLSADDIYKVQTDSGLLILNLGGSGRKVEVAGQTVEVPALSIVRR
jgi:hypothetical protein